jgi:hypothetical protein
VQAAWVGRATAVITNPDLSVTQYGGISVPMGNTRVHVFTAFEGLIDVATLTFDDPSDPRSRQVEWSNSNLEPGPRWFFCVSPGTPRSALSPPELEVMPTFRADICCEQLSASELQLPPVPDHNRIVRRQSPKGH